MSLDFSTTVEMTEEESNDDIKSANVLSATGLSYKLQEIVQ